MLFVAYIIYNKYFLAITLNPEAPGPLSHCAPCLTVPQSPQLKLLYIVTHIEHAQHVCEVGIVNAF